MWAHDRSSSCSFAACRIELGIGKLRLVLHTYASIALVSRRFCVSYTPGCATYSFWGHMPKMGMVVLLLQVVCLLLLSLTLSIYGRRRRWGVLTPPLFSLFPPPSSLSHSPPSPSTRQISHGQHRKSALPCTQYKCVLCCVVHIVVRRLLYSSWRACV